VLNVVPTQNSVSFVLDNKDNATATIFYGVGTSEVYTNSIVVVGGGLSPTLTVSGLQSGTSYNIYAEAQADGKLRSVEVNPTPFTTLEGTYTVSGFLDAASQPGVGDPSLSVTITVTSATYNETSQTNINNLGFVTIDDSVPEETYSLQLNTVQSFVFGGVTYTFLFYRVNNTQYGSNTNRSITVTGINQNTQIEYIYTTFGGF
jgi:hypothetical protein